MAEWQRARMIPVSGIGSAVEAEQRATSALLAVLGIVRPLSKSLLSPLGASRAEKATVETFIEVSFKRSDGSTVRPDGAIRVSYGKSEWCALVEVKTGTSTLEADQLNAYWEVARTEGFDAVFSISNEIALSPGVHPTDGLKQRANSKVRVHHVSWTKLLSMAVIEKTHRGVDDPEQDWILGELIRYLEHDASGVMQFDDMGANWTIIRDGARAGTLNGRDGAVTEIAQRWDQLLGYVALRLGADIGQDVNEVMPRAHQLDPRLRTKSFVDSLCEDGTLAGALRVPNTVGDIEIVADLKARQNVIAVAVDAPTDKGGRGRIGWLVRQMRDANPNLVIEAYAKNARTGVAAPLGAVVEDSAVLLGDDKKEPVRFRVVARSELGANRKAGRKPGFTQSVVSSVESFYRDVLQNLTPYQARAPQLTKGRRPEPTEAAAVELMDTPAAEVTRHAIDTSKWTAGPTSPFGPR